MCCHRARLESKNGTGRGGGSASQANVPRALIDAMRAAVERRPEDEVHGPVPCTPATFELTLATDALLRQVLSLDFQERQLLMAPQNVAVTRLTRHSLKIEWVAPPSIPAFPVCGYSVLVSEDDGTAEGGHPEQEMTGFLRDDDDEEEDVEEGLDDVDGHGYGRGGRGRGDSYDDEGYGDYDDREDYDDNEDGWEQQQQPPPPRGASAQSRRAKSADRSGSSRRQQHRPASAFGSGFGNGASSAAARRSRSADRARRPGSSASNSAAASGSGSSAAANQQLALAKQRRPNRSTTGGRGGGGGGGKGQKSQNAPLLRFEAWGLKADTPYRFHIQAVNGQGRGLWVRTRRSTAQCSTAQAQHSTRLQHSAAQHSTLLDYSTAQHSTALYSNTAQNSIAQRCG